MRASFVPTPASAPVAATLLAALLASCVSFDWERAMAEQPIDGETLERIPAPGAGLQACLDLLGAPMHVWEHDVHGLVLVWAWTNARLLGGSVSVPVTENTSVSFSYDDVRTRRRGVVLWFDAAWKLEAWRHGWLADLVDAPPRPATLEEIERG